MQTTSYPIARTRPEAASPGGSWGTRDTYRTGDGVAFFEFEFVRTGDHYEIDILQQPSYRNRPPDLHSTHRLPSARSTAEYRIRIRFSDPRAARDLAGAYKWAGVWAEYTWAYIRTGTPFPSSDGAPVRTPESNRQDRFLWLQSVIDHELFGIWRVFPSALFLLWLVL